METNFPEEYKGKWVVLFSHPANFTPVCTTKFVAFQKRYEDFEKLNTQVIGLSIDQVFSHRVQWINETLGVEIKFPVIANDRGQIAELFGIIHSVKATNTVRAVFIINSNGVLRAVLYYPQEVGRNIDEIIRKVKGLQVNDQHKVALPVN